MARRDRPVSQRQAWWLLAAALGALLPLVPQLPWSIAAGAGGMLALRGWITWRQWRLPARWLLILLVVAGTAAVFYNYRTLFGRVPGIALLTVFLSLKLLELRAARDAVVVVLLCYFLVLAQFMFQQTLGAAAIAMLTVLLTTATLAAASDDRPAPLLVLRRSALMLAQALPFMLVLFILFPRVEGPLWGLPQDRFTAVSGLSDSMSPGSIAQLSQSDAVAFRVKFDGTPPPQTQLYWRGPVMPQFDGRTWRVSRNTIVRQEIPYTPRGAAYPYEVTLEPHGKFWMFALEHPDTLPPDSGLSEDLQILSRSVVRNRVRYALQSFPETDLQPREGERLRREALVVPATGNSRTRAVAAEWRARHGDDHPAIVRAAEEFFARQLLSYTLNPPLLGEDPVDGFLFDTKRGFCEHFSSAFAFALRAAGVPARVVAGYQGGEINAIDGYLIVRQYDAHAWTEVWLEGRGWVRIDPTAISAPRRIADNIAAAVPGNEALPMLARTDLSWLREARLRLDALTNTWNQWVLGYTPQRQRELLQILGLRSPDWQTMTVILAVLSGLILAILTALILYQHRRSDPLRRAWLRFVQRLARRGVRWQPWEGPRDFGRRAAAELPDHAGSISGIVDLYVRLRYGPASALAAQADLQHLHRLIRRFRP